MIERTVAHKTYQHHKGAVIDTIEEIDVIACETCGFKHIIPLPSEEELNALYAQEYYQTEKPQYLANSEEDLLWWEITYQEYFHLFETYLPKNGARLLEIGSGPGFFLKCGKQLGWDVMGIEPSSQAYAYSQQFGVNVVHDFFNKESAKHLGKFDLIFMDTFLEHIPDPIGTIALCRSLLNPKGMLCIISPNDYNPLQKILREEADYPPWWVVPKHHLNYFDFDSIQHLLRGEGFQMEETLGSFPMEFFLLCGEDYVRDPKIGRTVHRKRKTFEQLMLKSNPELLRAFYRWLGKQGIGRSFVVLATVS